MTPQARHDLAVAIVYGGACVDPDITDAERLELLAAALRVLLYTHMDVETAQRVAGLVREIGVE